MEHLFKFLDLSPECTQSLLAFQLPSSCLSMIISKLLGYLIIVGSLVLKVPQIMNIVRSGQVKGLNINMFLLELIGYSINLFYSYRLSLPFSTYGENVFMIVQNLVILLLFFQYERGFGIFFVLVTSTYSAFLYGLINDSVIDMSMMTLLSTLSIPIFTASKLPQIYTNFKNKSTGELSVITCVLQLGGTAARVFTTLKEVDDKVILTGFLLGLVLNAIITLQIFWYWNNSGSDGGDKTKKQPATTHLLPPLNKQPQLQRSAPKSWIRSNRWWL